MFQPFRKIFFQIISGLEFVTIFIDQSCDRICSSTNQIPFQTFHLSVHIGRAYVLHNHLSDMMIDLHQLNKKVERLPSWRTLSILHMEGMPCQLKRDAKFGGLMQCAEKRR